jgi:hypothetical protein
MAHYHCLIFAGQSNMGGYGSIAGLPLASSDPPEESYAAPTAETFPCLWYETNTTAGLSAWNTSFKQDASTYGPELACMWRLKASHPTWNFAGIKVSFGGSSALEWFGTGGGGEGYAGDILLEVIGQAEGLLDLAGHTYEWAGWFWLQGETGTMTPYNQLVDPGIGDAAFITPTLAGFDLIRAATDPAMPIVVGRIGDHMGTAEYLAAEAASNGETDPRDGLQYDEADFLAALQRRWAQQAEVVAATPNSVLVNMDGFGNRTVPPDADAIHWPDAGYLAAGERFATAYDRLLAGRRRLAVPTGRGRLNLRVGA